MLYNESLYKSLAKIASVSPKGFTYNIRLEEPVAHGYVVPYAATQGSIGNKGLLRAIEHATTEGEGVVGGWLDKKSGEYTYGSCLVTTSLDVAIFEMDRQGQETIHCLATGREITRSQVDEIWAQVPRNVALDGCEYILGEEGLRLNFYSDFEDANEITSSFTSLN